VACLLYDFFLVGDYLLNPSYILHCIVLRLFIFTPATVVALVIIKRWQNCLVNDTLCVVMTTLAAVIVLHLYFGHRPTMSAFAQSGLLVIMGLGTLILRISLPFVAIASSAMFSADLLFLSFDRWLNSAEKTMCVFLVGTFAMLSVVARIRTEGLERHTFLLHLKEDLRSHRYAMLNQDLSDLSVRDPLTGLYNRRHLNEYLGKLWELARLDAVPISMIVVDIDYFKEVNDNYGHLFGDEVLTRIAHILGANVRGGEDTVTRFGGDEFVVIQPGVGKQQAGETAERFCKNVRETGLIPPDSNIPLYLTVSCGVATAYATELSSFTDLFSLADRQLYRAKKLGRNRASYASETKADAASG
jgi:diguanylate cyclase (GGDEF)-like protein